MKNKITLNQKFDRKIASSNINFSKLFLIFIFISLAIIIAGAFVAGFAGFNLGSDFASLSSLKVYTNSENYMQSFESYDIDSTEGYNLVLDKIGQVLKENNTSMQSAQKSTMDFLELDIIDAKAVEITFYNDPSLTVEEQAALNAQIKEDIMTAFGYQTQDSIVLENGVSAATILNSYNHNTTIIYSAIIAIVIAAVFAMVYMLCRYERPAFVSVFLTIVHDILLSLALIAITRIPFNIATTGVICFTFFMSVINLMIFYSKSKELTASGAVDPVDGRVVANETTKANLKSNIYIYAAIFLLSILLIAFAPSMIMRFFALALLISAIVNFYSAIFIVNGLYYCVYKPIKKTRKFI